MALRHVDATRPAGVFARVYAAVAATGFARFLSRHVNWRLDPWLLRVSKGRIASTLMFPTALLETTGAKTGEPRRNAIIYFHDNENVIVVASNAGSPRDPSWYHNLRANPDVRFGGIAMRAAVVGSVAERERLWPLADNVFPAFKNYRIDAAKTQRVIPIVQLIPR